MGQFIDMLSNYGADINGISERFMGDWQLYEECLKIFCNDSTFSELKTAIKKDDYKSAFEIAHNLKGVTGNLGLLPLLGIVCDLVEKIRDKDYTNLMQYYERIMEEHKKIQEISDS